MHMCFEACWGPAVMGRSFDDEDIAAHVALLLEYGADPLLTEFEGKATPFAEWRGSVRFGEGLWSVFDAAACAEINVSRPLRFGAN